MSISQEYSPTISHIVSSSLFEEIKKEEGAEDSKLSEYQPPEVEIVQNDNMFEINPEEQKSDKSSNTMSNF